MRDHGHNFASKRLELTDKCLCHNFNGLFILVATTPDIKAMGKGATPPPTRSCKIESRIRTNPPFFLSKNTIAHIMTMMLTTIAIIPVAKKLGMIV
jgi:hypothetical protein